MTPNHRQSGFTLIELIVAATLTTLVTGATIGILRSAAATKNLANTQLALQRQARAAVLTIATALANADRYPERNAKFEGLDDWIGDTAADKIRPADRIRFFTVSRKQIRHRQPESDIKECQFYLAQPPDKPLALLMRRTDPTRNKEPDEGGVVEAIAENILGLNFVYHDGIDWYDDWPYERSDWPLAVRIELKVATETFPQKTWTTSRTVTFPHRIAQNQQSSEQE